MVFIVVGLVGVCVVRCVDVGLKRELEYVIILFFLMVVKIVMS